MSMSTQGVLGFSPKNQRNIGYERVPVLGVREISNRPYSALPSGRSALVRVSASQTPSDKPFLTDYST